METALLIGTLLFQSTPMNIIAGAAIGTLSAAFVAWLWSRYGYRVNLGLFFQVTAVFLLVFVVQLLIYGFHELTEANIFPYSEPLHWATEPYGPDGRYGQYLTYLLVMLPLGWLALSSLRVPRREGQRRRHVDPRRDLSRLIHSGRGEGAHRCRSDLVVRPDFLGPERAGLPHAR